MKKIVNTDINVISFDIEISDNWWKFLLHWIFEVHQFHMSSLFLYHSSFFLGMGPPIIRLLILNLLSSVEIWNDFESSNISLLESEVSKRSKIIYQIWEHVPQWCHPILSAIHLTGCNIDLSFLRIAHCSKNYGYFSGLKRAPSFLSFLQSQLPQVGTILQTKNCK